LAIYNLFFHPLRNYPGPKIWAVSRIPYVYSLCAGRYAHDLRYLHDKYGKWVRTGPEELSIIEPQAWRDIYGYGGTDFDYNPVWTQKAMNGVWSIIFAPKEDHTRMKRVIGPAFSMAAVREQEPIIQTYVTKLVEIFREKTKGGAVVLDINSYMLWTTFDMIVSIHARGARVALIVIRATYNTASPLAVSTTMNATPGSTS
jgi:cytochrome P450